MTETAISPLDYYEVFEQALSALTHLTGEYRRHFGSSSTPAPSGYCWFKGVVSPDRHPDYAEWLRHAGTEMESLLLADLPRLAPRSVLDIGCGNGALLKRLAAETHGTSLVGINFQPVQVRTARRLLAGTTAEIIEADFLQHDFQRQFSLVCMIESAFHMPDKRVLCRRIADVLAPGGEAWLIDIVIAERAANAFRALGGGQQLFNYVPRLEWQESFRACGLEEHAFIDLSRGAADVVQVSEIERLEREHFLPRLRAALAELGSNEDAEAKLARSLELMVRIATEYKRLSRLLRGGMLQYVLMRYRARPRDP
jgi:SAM-dependent methyltransferase